MRRRHHTLGGAQYVAGPRRAAGYLDILERCAKALYRKARELCDRKIVASEEECDLAFVFGIGFAMHLGGPIFYAKTRGWA